MTRSETLHQKRNRFLSTLPAKDSQALISHGEIVTLELKQRLYADDRPVDSIYFPIDAVVSVLVGSEGCLLEMATIGKEGFVGAPAILDDGRTIGTTMVQLEGVALRVDMKVFQRALAHRPAVERLIKLSLYALIFQMMQSGACHHLHTVEQQCARWLLLMRDGAGRDTFLLTQGFLSEMLCVRRASVNLAVGAFRKAGYIRYIRGRVTVVDLSGLESAACDCYKLIRDAYERLESPGS
ncbi:MAG: Crp/Fnr family transcriptional regulator [Bryobacteraceae bacterium]